MFIRLIPPTSRGKKSLRKISGHSTLPTSLD
jgi:hypothetical protein